MADREKEMSHVEATGGGTKSAQTDSIASKRVSDANETKAYPTVHLRLSSVLFWDVLGWSAFAVGPEAQEHLEKLYAGLERATRATQTRTSSLARQVAWLTDNLVIGVPVDEGGLREFEGPLGHVQLDAAYLCLYLLDDGYLSRGFISIGGHYQSEHLAYGPALIEAVNGEKATRFPRVALSGEVAELCEAYAKAYYGEPSTSPHNNTLLREDDVVFVDYLTAWLTDEDDLNFAEGRMTHLAGTIAEGLAQSSSAEVTAKWKWTADYFNSVADRYDFRDRVDAGAVVHVFSRLID